MNVSSHRQAVRLNLSRKEQWVLHHVVLDRIELETRDPEDTDPPPLRVFHAFEKLNAHAKTESQQFTFTLGERECLYEQLRRYAMEPHTPECDRTVAIQLLPRLANPMRRGLVCNESG